LVILYFSKFFCEETLPNRNGKSIIYAHLYKLNVTKNTKTIENSSKSTLIFKAVDVFRSQIHNVLQASNGSSITIATSTILVSQFLLYTFFLFSLGERVERVQRDEAIPFLFIATLASLVTGALVGTSRRSNFLSVSSGTVVGTSGRSSTASC
jgi:hypothetical protein